MNSIDGLRGWVEQREYVMREREEPEENITEFHL
jgi:hypothetical protein